MATIDKTLTSLRTYIFSFSSINIPRSGIIILKDMNIFMCCFIALQKQFMLPSAINKYTCLTRKY